MHIINYLIQKYYLKFSIYQAVLECLHTMAKIRLSSDSMQPNKATSSLSLFGCNSLHNMTISYSIPIAVVPCLHTCMYNQHEMMTGIMYIHMEELLLHTECTAVSKSHFHNTGLKLAKIVQATAVGTDKLVCHMHEV